MKMERAKATYRAMSWDNQIFKAGIGASLILNMAFGYALISRPETVVLMPPFESEEMRFTSGRANSSYFKNWAYSTAVLLGNLDPSNTEFVTHNLQRLATPALYTRIEARIEGELAGIIEDQAVVTFAPTRVLYDPEIDRYFVPGVQRIGGPGTRVLQAKDITYEMQFVTEWNRVFLADIRVYDGSPLTSDIREERIQSMQNAAAADG